MVTAWFGGLVVVFRFFFVIGWIGWLAGRLGGLLGGGRTWYVLSGYPSGWQVGCMVLVLGWVGLIGRR